MYKKKGKRRGRFITSVMGIILAVFLVYVFSNTISAKSEIIGELHLESIAEVGIEFEQIALQDITNTYKLLLVNAQYPNEEIDQGIGLVSAYKRVPISNQNILLEEETLQNVERMVEAGRKDGFNPVITSGYRTREVQATLFEEAQDKDYVARPGESEHELGLAIDVHSFNGVRNANLYNWFDVHAYQYGFILRYPESKFELTGIAYEPWHYRFVGIPHSFYISQNNICLEEYINVFVPDKLYTLRDEKRTYLIYRATPVHGEIRVPATVKYDVSGDGTGSYIVTAKLSG